MVDSNGTYHAGLLNDVPNANAFLGDRPTLMPGNSVVYRAHVSIPPGWCHFHVVLGGHDHGMHKFRTNHFRLEIHRIKYLQRHQLATA